MASLIGIKIIIDKHFETLNDENANHKEIFFIFALLPLIIALVFIYFHKFLTNDSINALITAFSIFTGLLLNVILILFTIVTKPDQSVETTTTKNRKRLLEHLYANSIYALLISTLILVLLIIAIIWNVENTCLLLIILSSVVYFGLTHFILTLFMVFKRLFILLFTQFDQ
jgi:hypothetical protein